MAHKRVPLAIVGIGCRMPGGVTNPDQLWDLISAGKDGYCEVPHDRWDWRRYFSDDENVPGKIYVRRGAFLQQDIKEFDAEFFGISPREARSLDPQQRLLLEATWEAIDDAGLSLDRLAGSRTGVYIGALTLDNMLTQMSAQNCHNIGANSAASSTMTMLSNRLSYFLDLHGPSLSIDTACSSSLVAFHLACQSIWSNESDMALVGGVNVMFRPEYMVAMCKGQFLAPDGRSKSFDDRADGYGRGEGAGVIIVKPLERAIADGDRIYALVRATGCNQDGRTNGITVPNPEAQKTLILSVLEQSEIPASRIRYVEAHGTGTPVGDPIEARAIGETLGRDRNDERLTIGSVKANVGHLEAASGVTGLIKLCMCYKYGAIPPVANLGEPNRAIPFDALGLRLPTTLEPLPTGDEPILFAINSFGYGGTNAHAILENPPRTVTQTVERARQMALLPVSARSESALRAMVSQYRELLLDESQPWREICSAAGLRRTHHDFRAAFVGSSREELIGDIDEWLATASSTSHRARRSDGEAAKPVFVFSGMGPQWWGMGQQLFEREPVFREFVTRADQAFQLESGWSILDEMRQTKENSRINQTIYAQPAIFVLQAALLELMKSWGVHPQAVIGHSLGENASAYAAGVLSLEQAVHVGYHRSQILARAAGIGGGMLAVGLSEDDAVTVIAPYGDRVTIAAINGPKGVTLAGEIDALDEVAGRLKVKSIFNRKLQVEVAYHSAFMTPLQQPLIDALADLRPREPRLDIYSTVTGAAVTGVAYDGPYWARNIRQSVQFVRALQSAVADGHQLFLEIGAHPALTASIREYSALNKLELTVVPTLVRETDELKTLFKSLASLYAAGCDLDWVAINGAPAQMLPLPAYAWQRETHWEEKAPAIEERIGGPAAGLAGRRLDSHEPVWERRLNNKYLPYIDDHVVDRLVLLPGAAFVDAALSVQKEIGQAERAVAVEDLHFRKPLVVDRNDDVILRTAFDGRSNRLVFYGKSETQPGGWTRHAEGRLSGKVLARPAAIDIEHARAALGEARDVDAFYSRLTGLGLEYGSNFRRIIELRANSREVLAKLAHADATERYDIQHVLNPPVLDSAFQSLLAAIDGEANTAFVPASIEQVAVFDEIPNEVWCYGRVTRHDHDGVAGNLSLIDDEGRVLATVTGIRCARIPRAAGGQAALLERRLFGPTWHDAPLEGSKQRTGTWMVLAEGGFPEDSFAEQVADSLRHEGCDSLVTVGVDTGEDAASGVVSLEVVRTAEEWKRLFEEYDSRALAGIAYIARGAVEDNADISIVRAGHLLELFKQLPSNESGPRTYLVTEHAQAVAPGDPVDGFVQASAAGFFRVAHNEYPGLTCSVIDHDGSSSSAANVAAELLADAEADDVAWRDGVRYAQRIEAASLLELEKANLARRATSPAANDRVILARTETGFAATGDPNRDALYWKHEVAPALAADELEIEVAYWQVRNEGAATRGLTVPAWREFSGRVSRAGASVKGWRPGEAIAAAACVSLASHVVVREADLRAIKPGTVPLAPASSLAITAASVNVTLRQLARASRGERVLVVGAAHDDVGRMFAGAANAFGLDLISARIDDSALGVSVDHPSLDLRSDEFEPLALAANDGRPFDIVVFCAPVSQALYNRIPLAFGGRVVLLGPAIESVDPSHFIDAATMYSLHRVNPAALVASNTPGYHAALREVAAWTHGDGVAAPARVCSADALLRQPLADLPSGVSQTVDMSVLRELAPAKVGEAGIDPEAAYVITGGFGGFGLAVASYLVEQGARHITLIGRSGAATDGVRRQIAAWRGDGVTVREALFDITSRTAVEALFAELSAEREVKGIIHAAGLVSDIRIADMTRDQLVAVMRPKVLGAWNLHLASLRHQLPLDHFVLFSSVASLVGNGGQANYVAANAVLDSLASYRRARGLAATSINWGALAEVGMATNDDLRRQFQLMGINPFGADEAMFGLEAVLRFQPAQIGIMDVDWVQWGKFEPTGGKSLRFAHLTGKRGGGGNDSLADSLRHMPAEERFAIVELMLAEQVAQTLRIPAERIDVKRPLTEMGIDSLMTVELQIAINMTFGVELSALELTRGFCITQLTTPLLERMGLATGGAGDLDTLSEAELDALLADADVTPVASGVGRKAAQQ